MNTFGSRGAVFIAEMSLSDRDTITSNRTSYSSVFSKCIEEIIANIYMNNQYTKSPSNTCPEWASVRREEQRVTAVLH